MDGDQRDQVQSLVRGLAVIRAFGDGRTRMTLSDVAAHTGLTRAAARRFLLTLAAEGYAASDGKLFWLTARVLDLGFSYLTSLPFRDQAQTAITDVVRELGESCSASVLDGDEIVYVARVAASRIMTEGLSVGSRLPALFSSMGRVMLAGVDDAALDRLLAAAPFPARTPQTVTDADALRAMIANIRRDGFAITDQELEPGLISIAVPLRDGGGRPVAAINVSSHRSRSTPQSMHDDVLPVLRRAAERIGVVL